MYITGYRNRMKHFQNCPFSSPSWLCPERQLTPLMSCHIPSPWWKDRIKDARTESQWERLRLVFSHLIHHDCEQCKEISLLARAGGRTVEERNQAGTTWVSGCLSSAWLTCWSLLSGAILEPKGQGVSALKSQDGPSGERTQPLNKSRQPPGLWHFNSLQAGQA